MTEVPTGSEDILLFWSLMLRVLKRIDSQKIEFWEFDSVVENALSLDMSKEWDPKKTYEILPKSICYLCRTTMDTNDMMFLHMRLRIQLEQYDKEKLEKKKGLIIETDSKGYVIKWSRKVEEGGKEAVGEKKDGNSMEKEEANKEDKAKLEELNGNQKVEQGDEKKKEAKGGRMGRGKAFTADEERAILEYVFSKVKNDNDFGIKSSKLTRKDDWTDLEKKPGMSRTAASLADHYRKHMQNRLYSIQGVEAECLLAIGKAHGVSMSDRIKRAFEMKYDLKIKVGQEKIISWEWSKKE